MKPVKISLIIERGEEKVLWGRVLYKGNLITDFASSISELEQKMKNLMLKFEEVNPESLQFEHHY